MPNNNTNNKKPKAPSTKTLGDETQQLVVNRSTNNVLQQCGFNPEEIRQAVTYLGRENLELLKPFFKKGPADAAYIEACQEAWRITQAARKIGVAEQDVESPLDDLCLSEEQREGAFDVYYIAKKLDGVITALTVNIALSSPEFITDFLYKYYYSDLPTFSDLHKRYEAQQDGDSCEYYDYYIETLLNSLADKAMNNRSPDPLKVLIGVLSRYDVGRYEYYWWQRVQSGYKYAEIEKYAQLIEEKGVSF